MFDSNALSLFGFAGLVIAKSKAENLLIAICLSVVNNSKFSRTFAHKNKFHE
jgi:hypothetical protein